MSFADGGTTMTVLAPTCYRAAPTYDVNWPFSTKMDLSFVDGDAVMSTVDPAADKSQKLARIVLPSSVLSRSPLGPVRQPSEERA
jgi:hypothetical protein